MGRHRRHAAGRAATSRATGVNHTDGSAQWSHDSRDSYPDRHSRPDETVGIAPYLHQDAYAGAYATTEAYLFTGDGYGGDYAPESDTAFFASEGFTPADGSERGRPNRRKKKKAVTPVRTGLLGVSAAVAIGTVAVATGVLPGGDNYTLGGGSSDKVQAADSPTSSPSEQGGTSGSAENRDDSTPASRDQERSVSPSAAPSTSAPAPTKTPSKKPTATPSKKPKTNTPPSKATTKAPEKPSAPVTLTEEAAAAAEVLRLVNEERAKVGCSAVAANSSLAELASAFSEDMAERGFFDHTDPDGSSPWDRAAKAGITNLGGENIARGQADAAAVMDAWMNSPGHRANILNCDFKTLGVGVHMASGGPWWTQNFGY
ncbi:transmembrane protein [Streptomyces davaonensis JCM 4913]|uniref:Transmembrane protein n=1 Tax=Streptomyces davaonensis (strain DSM 101723 / JCM 4913 / KCC S-0913 / 768) TaxID=1214101 RepID=K4R226_STRDJ|nr:CAP domain-containing protein [Streptomyces davaonensis]CCK27197.1 transmembrane protein [Streptomyces davaonensis JCM 4913]